MPSKVGSTQSSISKSRLRADGALRRSGGLSSSPAMTTPIPALPDTERRTPYSVTTTTAGPFNVGFDLYADGSDFLNWLQVFVDGAPVVGWTLSSPSGPIANLERPITNAQITFAVALVGTVPAPKKLEIVGARRPRRLVQLGNAPTPRDLNRVFTDIVATLREFYDRFGRVLQFPAGETVVPLPPAAQRANKYFAFDAVGNPSMASPLAGGGGLTKNDVGLGNVDNTSDANKPVSAAQAAAIAFKVDKSLYNAESIVVAIADDTPVAVAVPASSFVGRKAAGDVGVMTAAEAAAVLPAVVGDVGAGGTKGLVPAPAAGDAAKFLKGDGTWGAMPGAATDVAAGIIEIATDAEAVAGADATRAVSPASAKAAINARTESLIISASDETTGLTVGTLKTTFRMPYALNLTAVRGSLSNAQVGGTILTVNIKKNGVSILTTKLTIDNGEKTSTTAAVAAVIGTAVLADDDEITIDIDQIGDGTAKGLKVALIGTR
jgi:hypothetical protein